MDLDLDLYIYKCICINPPHPHSTMFCRAGVTLAHDDGWDRRVDPSNAIYIYIVVSIYIQR